MWTSPRLLAAIGAPLIGAATLSQGWLSVSEIVANGGAFAEGVSRYLCYFTVLTNVFVVIVLARAALRPGDRTGLNAPRVELMAATSILFVGAVYNLLLASLWDPQGLRKINDVILHDISPLGFALFWLLRSRGVLRWRDAVFTAAWPAAYTIYAQVRGALDGFYPYFFTDPTRASWPQVLLNMAGLMGAFVVAALLLVALDNTVARRQPQN
jgi:hypothetical protein